MATENNDVKEPDLFQLDKDQTLEQLKEAVKLLDTEKPSEEVKSDEEDKPDEELIPAKTEFNKEEAERKLEFVLGIINKIGGGDSVSGKIYPILDPKQWKTTTFISEGQVYSILAMLTLYNEAPLEAYPCLDWCYDLCLLSLSRDGFGIGKAIDLGKALTEKGVGAIAPYESPDKPQKGMKDKP